MEKVILGMVSGLIVFFLSVSGGLGSNYEQVTGKVTMYNETGLTVSLTIVGQESNLNIDPDSRLPYPFNPNAPTDLKFWYWKDKIKHELGVVSVFPGDVYVITPDEIKTIIQVARPQKPAYEPDFNDPAAVLADLERMKKEAQAKKGYLAAGKCNYAINVINNFMRVNPEGDPSILKQRWQEAYDEYVKVK
ncbi:MAG: hypothetical protein OEM01_02935 [Desulfobulbaceae bacterium]|nr:hypothetical protein [Desulfobulbaceae bacterium]